VEEEAGTRLIVTTGGLDLWPPEAETPIEDYSESLRACDVGFELLEAGDIAARWPQFNLRAGTVGLWQEAGGIVAAARANSAHRRLARAHGATLRANTPVTSLRARGDEVEVTTADGVVLGARVVVAADAWTNQVLAPLGLTLPLRVTQEQVTYFAASRPGDFDPERFPIWIWMGDPSFYGFPTFGEAGTKVGQDLGGREVTVDSRTFETDRAALGRVEEFLRAHLPGAHGPVISTKSCLYTVAPDRDFIVDFVPGHPNVLVAQGAAHAFKFASLLGRAVSELAIDDHTGIPLEPFGMSRAALADPSGADRAASAAPDHATPVVGGLM